MATAKTQLFGIIGEPVAHSLSPQIFGFLFRKTKRRARYDLWPTAKQDLSARLQTMRDDPAIGGANVTIPHKQAVLPQLDAVDESARRIGAVNCIRKTARQTLEGFNTDVTALSLCLHRMSASLTRRRLCFMIVGAGGAARAAAAAALQQKNARVLLCARRPAQARTLQRAHPALRLVSWARRHEILAQCDMLINASAGGMAGMAALDLDIAALPPSAGVLDMVYRPLRTPLLRATEARGLVSMDGLYMLIFQALENYRLWFPQQTAALSRADLFPALYQLCRSHLTPAQPAPS